MMKSILKYMIVLLPIWWIASANCSLHYEDQAYTLVHSESTYSDGLMLWRNTCEDTWNVSITTMRYMIQDIDALNTFYTAWNIDSKRKMHLANKNIMSNVESMMDDRYTTVLASHKFTWDRTIKSILETDSIWQQLMGLYYAISFYENDKEDFLSASAPLEVSIDTDIYDLTWAQSTWFDARFMTWNTGANISLIEFADVWCSTCIYNYQQGVIQELLSSLSWTINYTYAPIDIGYWWDYQAKAMLCAGTLSWSEAYYKMHTYIYENSYPIIWSHNVMLASNASVAEYGEILGIGKTNLENCITSWDAQSIYENNYDTALGFDLSGTPTTIIINHDTQKRASIWARYNTGAYIDLINSLWE